MATGGPSPLASSSQDPPVGIPAACPGLSHTHCVFHALGTHLAGASGKCVMRHLSTLEHRRLCWDQHCYRDTAASFHSGEVLSHGHYPSLAEAEGLGFASLCLNAVASNPEHWSCPKFDHFILHTQQLQKTATKSKLFSCSWRLVLFKWQHAPLWGGGEVALSALSRSA